MMGTRHKAREVALKALYEADAVGHSPQMVLSRLVDGESLTSESAEFASCLVSGVCSHMMEIDEVIRKMATAYPVEQLAAMDRNILRLAIWELLIDNKVPMRAVISEAVELATQFGGEASPKFVNGVLGSVSLMTASR